MNLYLVHCGFYDADLCDGLYESHVNFFVAAENFDDARAKVKQIPEYKAKKMQVDGLQEIKAVGGFQIHMKVDPDLRGENRIVNFKHRDLAPPRT